jgi:hypothetical protein
MSILTHIPTQLTDDQKLTLKADGIKRSARAGFARICDIQRSGIDHLWKDRTHSPQEIIDALGSDALKIFQMHGILTDAINQIAAIDGISPEITLPTNAFEVVDGSIVVSEDPYA